MSEPLVATAQHARRLYSLLLVSFVIACGSGQEEVELRAVSQAANAQVSVKRDAVFVINADPLNTGGACTHLGRVGDTCTPIVPASDDSTNACGSCAGTKYFDAQVRGVVRALEGLRELDGSTEVSVIIDTSGVISEWKNDDATVWGLRHPIFSGPRVLLNNVRWTKQTAPSSIALVRGFAMQALLYDQENPFTEHPNYRMVPTLADDAPWASYVEALNQLNHPSAKGQLCLALPPGGVGTRYMSARRPPFMRISSLNDIYTNPSYGGAAPYPRAPTLGETFQSKVVQGELDELSTVAMPIHNPYTEAQAELAGYGNILKHYRLRGAPKRDGTLKFNLDCESDSYPPAFSSPYSTQIAISVAKRTMERGKWRSTNATDIIAALGPRVGEAYDSPAMCWPNGPQASCAIDEPVWWSSDRLIVAERDGGQYGTVSRSCAINIDAADLPGTSVEVTETGTMDAPSTSSLQAYRNYFDLTATSAATWYGKQALGAKVRHQLAASQLVGAAAGVEQVEAEIAGCLEPRPRLRAIEVTQAIQDWKNSVPLFAGKNTAIKVFLESEIAVASVPKLKLTLEREQCDQGSCEWVSSGAPMPPRFVPSEIPTQADSEAVRRDQGKFYVFQDMFDKDGPKLGRYRIHVSAPGVALECSEPDDSEDCTSIVTFEDSGVDGLLSITPVWIDARIPLASVAPSSALIDEAHNVMDNVLPTSGLTIQSERKVVLDMTSLPSAASPSAVTHELSSTLGWIRDYECSVSAARCNELGILHGISALVVGKKWYLDTSFNPEPQVAGVANPKHGAFVVNYGAAAAESQASLWLKKLALLSSAHELFHTLGRPHTVFCMKQSLECIDPYPAESTRAHDPAVDGDEWVTPRPMLGPSGRDSVADDSVWGYYQPGAVAKGKAFHLDPYHTFDLMSYCDGYNPDAPSLPSWVSKWQYAQVLPHLRAFVGSSVGGYGNLVSCPNYWALEHSNGACAGGTFIARENERCLGAQSDRGLAYLVALTLLENPTNIVDVHFPLGPVEVARPTQESVLSGKYILVRSLDASGRLLSETPLYLELRDSSSHQSSVPDAGAYFGTAQLPYHPEATILTFSTPDGAEIRRIAKSTHEPELTIATPTAGAIVTGPSDVSWVAADTDGDPLSFSAEYSADGGQTWRVVGVRLTQRVVTIDFDYVPGSANAYLRVHANDGFSTTTRQVGPFEVTRKAPKLTIEAPRGSEPFAQGTTIRFSANAVDQEDGVMEPATVRWSSDLDGALGVGRFTRGAGELTPGRHQITAIATDADGLATSVTTTIEVLAADAPHAAVDLNLSPGSDLFVPDQNTAALDVQVNYAGVASDVGTFSVTTNVPDGLRLRAMPDSDWSCTQTGSEFVCAYVGSPLATGTAALLRLELSSPVYSSHRQERLLFVLRRAGDADQSNNTAIYNVEIAASTIPPPAVSATSSGVESAQGDTRVKLQLDHSANAEVPGAIVTLALDQLGTRFVAGEGTGWVCGVAAATPREMKCAFTGQVPATGLLPVLTAVVRRVDPNATGFHLTYSVWIPQLESAPANGGGEEPPSNEPPPSALVTTGTVAVTTVPVVSSTKGLDVGVQAGEPCSFDGILPRTGLFSGCTRGHFMFGGTVIYDESARVAGGSWSTDVAVRNEGSQLLNGVVEAVMYAPPGTTMMNAQSSGLARNHWTCQKSVRHFSSDPDFITCRCDASGVAPGGYLALLTFNYWLGNAPSPTSATVQVNYQDVDALNNSAVHTFPVAGARPPAVVSGRSMMTAALELSTTQVQARETLTARVRVSNAGTSAVAANHVSFSAFGAPALLQVQSVSGDGWQCDARWGRADCRYTLAASLAPGAALPDLEAVLRAGPTAGMARVPVKVTNDGLLPAEVGALLETTGRAALPDHALVLAGCAPLSADCQPSEWPLPQGQLPVGSRIGVLSLARGELAPVRTDEDRELSWHSHPTWSSSGFLAYRTRSFWMLADIAHDTRPARSTPEGFAGTRVIATNDSQAVSSGRVYAPSAAAFGPGDRLAILDAGQLRIRSVSRRGRSYVVDTGVSAGAVASLRGISWFPDGQALVYSAQTGSDQKLWRRAVSGSGATLSVLPPVRLSSDISARSELDPSVSPDGLSVLFVTGSDLYLLNLSNGTEQRLEQCSSAEPCRHPTWSPDGQWLAYQRGDGDDAIFVRALAGGESIPVVRGREPQFRPVASAGSIVANVDHLVTTFGNPVSTNVLANDDGSGLSIASVEQPSRGSVTCQPNGLCTYAPGAKTIGDDTFVYRVRDAQGSEAESSAQITVAGVSPSVAITTPASANVRAHAPLPVRGFIDLERVNAKVRALYVVDLETHRDADGFLDEPNLSPWPMRPEEPALDLCADVPPSPYFNVVDCYVKTLNRNLAQLNDVEVGAVIFGRETDYLTGPANFRPNVGVVDLAPAPGQQAFVQPLFDSRGRGPEVEFDIQNVQTVGVKNCGVNCEQGHPSYVAGKIGFSEFFYPEWRNVERRSPSTLDFAIENINSTFAGQSGGSRNVAYLFSAGDRIFSSDRDSPIMRAVASGTTINVYTLKPKKYPIDVNFRVQTGFSMGEEQPRIRQLAHALANGLVASNLDFRLCAQPMQSYPVIPDYFADTVLAGDPRYVNLPGGAICSPRDAIHHEIVITDEGAGAYLPYYTETIHPPLGLAFSVGAPATRPLSLMHNAGDDSRVFTSVDQNATCATAYRPFSGTSLLPNFTSVCDEDWTSIVARIVSFQESDLSGCENPLSPFAQVAHLTGGKCEELTWSRTSLTAPLPPVPSVLAGSDASEVEYVELYTDANAQPVRAALESDGRFSGTLPDMPDGPTQLHARLVMRSGAVATADRVLVGVGGAFDRAPLAADDMIVVRYNQGESPTREGGTYYSGTMVVDNDSDPENGQLRMVRNSQPAVGSAHCEPYGFCQYVAPPGVANVSTWFTYTIADAAGNEATAMVRVEMDENRPPNDGRLVYAVEPGKPVTFDLEPVARDPDGDVLNYELLSSPSYGALECDGSTCTYTSQASESVVDTFAFAAFDGRYRATITIEMRTLVEPRLVGTLEMDPAFVPVRGLASAYLVLENVGAGELASLDEVVLFYDSDVEIVDYGGPDWECEPAEMEVHCRYLRPLLAHGGPSEELFVDFRPHSIGQVSFDARVRGQSIASATVEVTPDLRDAQVSLSSTPGSFCGVSYQQVTVTSLGATALDGTVVHGTVTGPAQIEDVHGLHWNCTRSATEYRCTSHDQVGAGASLDILEVTLRNTTQSGAAHSVLVEVPNDVSTGNDLASLALQPAGEDLDEDGVLDCFDNCIDAANADQLDGDADGAGDACDEAIQDVAVEVTREGSPFEGAALSYLVTVTNLGAAPTEAALDLSATGLSVLTLSGDDWVCALTAPFRCTLAGSLASGAASTLRVGSMVEQGAVSASLSGQVTAPNDADLANNIATDTSSVVGAPDLHLQLQTSELLVGTAGTLSIQVENLGRGATRAEMDLFVELPVGLAVTGASGPGWSCNALGSVQCRRAAILPAGAGAELTVSVLVEEAAYPNAQLVGQVLTAGELVFTNNSASISAPVLGTLDLAIAKSHVGSLLVEQVGSYAIVLRNDGTLRTQGESVIIDELPQGLFFRSAHGDGWTCGAVGSAVTCGYALPIAAHGAADVLQVDVLVGAAAAGTVTNVARVATANANASNDTASDPTIVSGTQDLALEVTQQGSAEVDSSVTFNCTVRNEGTISVPSLGLRHVLPAGFELVSAAGSGWTCSGQAEISCDHGTLAAHASTPTLQIITVPRSSAADNVLWTATVSADDDLNPANDSITLPVEVLGSRDVAVAVAAIGSFAVGSPAAYSIVVSNTGNRLISAFQVHTQPPSGLALLGASGSGWACQEQIAAAICTYAGALVPGQSAPAIQVAVLPNGAAYPTVSVHAAVTATGDAQAANNDATTTIAVTGRIDAEVTLVAPSQVAPGQLAELVATVRNVGTVSIAGPITLTQIVPVGMSLSSIGASGWSCNAGVCTYSSALAAGASLPPVRASAAVGQDAPDNVSWSVRVSAPADENTTNDQATSNLTVSGGLDLAIEQELTAPLRVGEVSSYRALVVNVGNRSTRAAINLSDDLPAGIALISSSGASWQCSTGPNVRCSYDAGLAAGAAATPLLLNVRPSEAAVGSRSNTMQVASIGDVDMGNNAATVTSNVTGVVDASLRLVRNGDLVVGSQAAYDLVVSSIGTVSVPTPISVAVTLPTGLSVVATTLSGWTCSGGTPYRCTWSSPLAPTAQAPILTLTVAVASNTQSPALVTAQLTAINDATSANNTASDSASVTTPQVPPAEARVVLWPPNHKLSRVTLSQCVVRRSSCPGAVTGRFTYASSDEGASAEGSGDQAPDLIFAGCNNIDLRVERMGSSNGRVYRLAYDVVDACGQRLLGACNVEIPHDQSGADALLGAESYRVSAPTACGN